MKAMLLAAGYGQRFLPHTHILPKPAFPFLNIPILYYPIFLLASHFRLTQLIINTHHLPEIIRQVIDRKSNWPFPIAFSHEDQILGTGGGLARVVNEFQNEDLFLLCNGDTLIFPSHKQVLPSLIQKHRNEKAIATLLVMKHPDLLKSLGAVWVDPKSKRIMGFGKIAPQSTLEPFHYTGLQVLSPRIFHYLPKQTPSDVFREGLLNAIQAGETVCFLEDEALWFETGDLKNFLEATFEVVKMIQQSRHWLLNETLDFYLGHSFSLSHPTQSRYLFKSYDSVFPEHATWNGFVVLGDGSQIQKDAHLCNVVVGPNSTASTGHHQHELFLNQKAWSREDF